MKDGAHDTEVAERHDVKLPDGRIVNVVRRHRPRHCDKCGDVYARRCKIICWPIQNRGHVWGWIKVEICLGVMCCAGQNFSVQLMKAATTSIGWNGPANLLKPPIEMEKVRVGVRAGIFKSIAPPKKIKKAKDKQYSSSNG
jgi:hypothetical protein